MRSARALLISMRPKQWVKNLVVFAPLVFSRLHLTTRHLVWTLTAFLVFTLISSAVYLMNDVLDKARDTAHPRKRRRPIANGELSSNAARIAAAVLVVAGVGLALTVNSTFVLVTALYLLVQLCYVMWLKHMALVDVFAISGSFVLRAIGGAVAASAPMSPWLYTAVSLLALVLALGKRRHELIALDDPTLHRPVLAEYSEPLLDALLSSSTAATIVVYSLYSFYSPTAQMTEGLPLTDPFVAFGLFRYLLLVYNRDLGDAPEEILLSDPPLITAILLWMLCTFAALYLL